MVRKNRKTRKTPIRKMIFIFAGVILFGCCVFLFMYFGDTSRVSLLQPIPSGVPFNIESKGSDQRLSDIEVFLQKEEIPYTSVRFASNSAILVSLTDNGDVYLSSKNYPEELASLQVIVSRLTMEGKRFSRLDLRFERPVIVAP